MFSTSGILIVFAEFACVAVRVQRFRKLYTTLARTDIIQIECFGIQCHCRNFDGYKTMILAQGRSQYFVFTWVLLRKEYSGTLQLHLVTFKS